MIVYFRDKKVPLLGDKDQEGTEADQEAVEYVKYNIRRLASKSLINKSDTQIALKLAKLKFKP